MYVDQVVRKDKFLAGHPEWSLVYVKSQGYFEASRDNPPTVLTDRDLKTILDRLDDLTR